MVRFPKFQVYQNKSRIEFESDEEGEEFGRILSYFLDELFQEIKPGKITDDRLVVRLLDDRGINGHGDGDFRILFYGYPKDTISNISDIVTYRVLDIPDKVFSGTKWSGIRLGF